MYKSISETRFRTALENGFNHNNCYVDFDFDGEELAYSSDGMTDIDKIVEFIEAIHSSIHMSTSDKKHSTQSGKRIKYSLHFCMKPIINEEEQED